MMGHSGDSQCRPGGIASQTEEDRAGQTHTDTLPDHAPGGQESCRASLLATWRRPHQGAIIWRLEETLSQADYYQTPDHIPQTGVGVELADQEEPDTGDSESSGSQPASAKSIGESAADWSHKGNGKRQRRQQQPGFLRL